MGIIDRFKQALRSNTQHQTKQSPLGTMTTGNNFSRTLSGHILQNNGAIFSVVSLLSNTLATLPIKLYEGQDEDVTSDIGLALKRHPNPYMNSFEFIQKLETDRNEYGNAYALIERDKYWQPVNLYPVSPVSVTVMENLDDNSIWYQVTGKNGNMLVSSDNMIHVKHISGSTRLVGISPLDVLRDTVDFNNAVQRFSMAQMNKIDSFKVKYGSNIDDEMRENVVKNFKSFIKSNGGVLFEQPGIEIEDLPRNFVASDLANTEKISDIKIANVFNVPLAFLNQEKLTNNEDLMSQLIQRTIIPIVRQYELEFTNKLLTGNDNRYFKFNVSGMLRGNVQARTAYYQALRRSGILTTNDIRAKEDLPLSNDEFADKLFISGDLYPMDMTPEQRKGVNNNGQENG